jgi:hypothetical protein
MEIKQEEYIKVETLGDLENLVQTMGWENLEEFTKDTGATGEELVGEFFLVVHNRVFVKRSTGAVPIKRNRDGDAEGSRRI